jgi:isoleucyl-tRNA synthetase
MVATRPDWCLSRQRLWGIPIPAVSCRSCGQVVLDKEIISRAADIFNREGSDSWFERKVEDFLYPGFRCPGCKGEDFAKEFDILDVWFESGASFEAVLKQHSQLVYPADLYLEGSDQHRGWFQVSLIPSVAQEGKSPFKTILTHGFCVDGEGRKMSKSLGNVIAPQEISQAHGAEILRLWAAASDYSEDIKISQAIIGQLIDTYRKVRNTIRFILGNLSDFRFPEASVPFEELREVDKFMAARAMSLLKEVIACYEEFSFYKVCQKVFNFCNIDLSSFYLDILKDRLYTFSQNSKSRRSAQFVLYHILDILLKALAPVLSFTAEEAYQAWKNRDTKKDSVFIGLLEEGYRPEWIDPELIGRWEKILGLRMQVLKAIEKKRESGAIGSSLEAAVFITCSPGEHKLYRAYKEALKEIFIVSSVEIKEGDFGISVEKAKGTKCARCWNWSQDVGRDDNHPDICGKCLIALKEDK